MHTTTKPPLPRKRKAADMASTTSSDEAHPSTIIKSTAKPTTTTPISRLLALPPELRNKIYRLTLLEPQPIPIRDLATLPGEPGLLQTSRQLRHEASPIYHQENTFKVYVVDYDSGAYRAWYRSSAARRRARKEYVIREATHWANLVVWLKAYYHGQSSKPGMKRSGKPCVNASLFSLVQRMKKVQRLGWEQVEANLEEVHQALAAMDPRWA